MGSDLFGSLVECLCASLLVSTTSEDIIYKGLYFYPLLIIATGIIISIFTSQYAFFTIRKIKKFKDIENTISRQMLISTLLLIPCIYMISLLYLPEKYNIGEKETISYREGINQYDTMICPISGLISGLLICFITEYYTSISYSPVEELISGCKKGPAINIIMGLSLGYISNIIPTILITISLYVSYVYSGMFGISLAAIGMLSNLPISLAIDGFGPIADNAVGLANMCKLKKSARDITDELDTVGNITAAIGKGFAIGSACLVAFALWGAFVTQMHLEKLNLNSALIFSGILFGTMLPYIFSALIISAVGKTAETMVQNIKEIFFNNNLIIEYSNDKIDLKKIGDFNPKETFEKCIILSTRHSLLGIILPGILVILTPISTGILFGPNAVAGYLIGVIISGVQMAISSINSGAAWDNCKKSIKSNFEL
jgi:H(+)-translocating pyrophosphatase